MVSNKQPIEKIRYLSINSGEIEGNTFTEIDSDLWKRNRNFLFDISSSKEDAVIIQKIKSQSETLSKLYIVRVGLQAYEKGKGKPKQTAEDVRNHVFDFKYKFDNNTYPYLNGSDIGRYKLSWTGQWLRYGEWISQPKTFEQFSKPRILIREKYTSA